MALNSILKFFGQFLSSSVSGVLLIMAPLAALAVYTLLRAALNRKLSERLESEFDQKTSSILSQSRKEMQFYPFFSALGVFVLILVAAVSF